MQPTNPNSPLYNLDALVQASQSIQEATNELHDAILTFLMTTDKNESDLKELTDALGESRNKVKSMTKELDDQQYVIATSRGAIKLTSKGRDYVRKKYPHVSMESAETVIEAYRIKDKAMQKNVENVVTAISLAGENEDSAPKDKVQKYIESHKHLKIGRNDIAVALEVAKKAGYIEDDGDNYKLTKKSKNYLKYMDS